MLDDDEADPIHPILACGHSWDGQEPWEGMAVILKAKIDGEEGPQPAISAGHFCRACRAMLVGERFASMAEAQDWLRGAGA